MRILKQAGKMVRTNKKYMLVRYGRMNELGLFEHSQPNVPQTPTRVVVKTEKGLQLGQIVGELGCYKVGQFKLNEAQINEYFDKSKVDFECKPAGKVIRYATSADLSEERHFKKIAEEELNFCQQLVKEMQLPMKIVDVDHIFGSERIIFYFMSEARVDFRELVKKLAHEYQSRIEMHQIGSRDEARLLGDFESCGQECCCRRFLKALKPVNMRMAKMQKATLDPAKISGYCGRLKCCLRYEDKTYTELKKQLPKKNARVKTTYGEGKVIDMQILTQIIAVELEDGRRVAVPVEELELLARPPVKKKKQAEEQDGSSRDNGKDYFDVEEKDNNNDEDSDNENDNLDDNTQ
jgi:cell fate regulator YaaT (PSP1 superfamily)